MKKLIYVLIDLFVFLCLPFAPMALGAPAVNPSCAIRQEMNRKEQTAFHRFHAQLSHLEKNIGSDKFESRLNEVLREAWGEIRLRQTPPLLFERLVNLVELFRLKDSIARTIGTKDKTWIGFERTMRQIILHGNTGYDVGHPLEKTTEKLLKLLGAHRPKKKFEGWETTRAEALLRTMEMHRRLQRWRVINGEISAERAAASAQVVATVGIGLIGAGVIIGTTVFSGPIVGGAGLAMAGASTNPVVAALLVRTAEVLAGSMLGLVGAPAAVATQNSYRVLSEATKQSANNNTVMSCELAKQINEWKTRAPDEMLSAALFGAGLGLGGGFLTFHPVLAKTVLYSTAFGVGVAQLYSAGKMSQHTLESLAHYKLAQEAEDAGDETLARQHLLKARDLAQEVGDRALEAVIIATLSAQVAVTFRQALHEGEAIIRQIYAASADTLPTAANATGEMASSMMGYVTGPAIETKPAAQSQ